MNIFFRWLTQECSLLSMYLNSSLEQMDGAFIKAVMVTTNFSVTDYTELLQNTKIAFNIIRTFKADNISTETS